MKAVLLSIKPKYCELIANGNKTIEVRKSEPKLKPPFKCYIYCTTKELLGRDCNTGMIYRGGSMKHYDDYSLCGHIIGEFICDGILDLHDNGNEFVNPWNGEITELLMPFSCLNYQELHEYANGKVLYGWHMSDLKIYDKPKELSEFHKPCINYLYRESCAMYNEYLKYCGNAAFHINRPPQSWCYVEEL